MKQFLFSILLFLAHNLIAQVAAVCVYEKGYVRQTPSQKAEVIQAISFGKEKVYLSDETVKVAEERNRIYEKVTTEEGEMGWILQEVLVKEGQAAVAKMPTFISPQPIANPKEGFRGEFQAGEVLIKIAQQNEFVKVYGFEKKKEGWVLAEDLIEGEEEVAEAVWLTRAYQEKTPCLQAEKIQTILNNPAFEINQVSEIVQNAFEKADNLCKNPKPENAKTPMKDEANNRGLASSTEKNQPKPSKTSTPKSNPTTTNKGKVVATQPSPKPYEKKVTPAPKTPAPNARTIGAKATAPTKVKGTMSNISPIAKLEGKVGEARKYVEKLQLVEVTTETNTNRLECYHNTLPKGAKIMLQLPNNEGEIELEVVGGLKTKAGLGLTNPTLKRIFGDKIPRFVEVYYLAK